MSTSFMWVAFYFYFFISYSIHCKGMQFYIRETTNFSQNSFYKKLCKKLNREYSTSIVCCWINNITRNRKHLCGQNISEPHTHLNFVKYRGRESTFTNMDKHYAQLLSSEGINILLMWRLFLLLFRGALQIVHGETAARFWTSTRTTRR